MAKYLLSFTYSAEGAKGLHAMGGSKREAAVKHAVESLGGKLDAFYFAFGDKDVFIIIDMPTAESAAALSITVGSTGVGQGSTTPLLTSKQIDEACQKSVGYQPPKG
jgi:uncharacterized protein with GYD domain